MKTFIYNPFSDSVDAYTQAEWQSDWEFEKAMAFSASRYPSLIHFKEEEPEPDFWCFGRLYSRGIVQIIPWSIWSAEDEAVKLANSDPNLIIFQATLTMGD